MKTEVLKIEKSIKAQPGRLFKAWLKAEDFSRWFLPGTPVSLGAVNIDARPGGHFSIEMLVDGIIRPHEGEYRVIEEPNKLVFTWRSFMTENRDTLVTVLFAAEGEGTRITLIHEQLPDDQAIVQAHTEGWSSILAGLAAWVV